MVKVCVIGSCAMDLVVTADKRPIAGETILGHDFSVVPGGKGANQAVAASRLGASVHMIGCVGDDSYGQSIVDNLRENGVDTTFMKKLNAIKSGTAHIILAQQDNSIIVIKGANDEVTPSVIDDAISILKQADIVLIQQEIPEQTVSYVSQLCHKHQVQLLLNPAPARALEKEVIEQAAYLTPNEHECEALFPNISVQEALKHYPNKLIITEGSRGVSFNDGSEQKLIAAYNVNAVDTTGAGDTFNAALAVALAEKRTLADALRFANRAASLSVTKFGAQGGMPTRREVEEAL